jgi:hypothetical protein
VRSYADYVANPALEQYSLHRQGHRDFHTLFWLAMDFSGRKRPTTSLSTA